MQSFMFGQSNASDQYSCEISALGRSSNVAKKSFKVLRRQKEIDHEFRESKTPRESIPTLNEWEIVKEKDIKDFAHNKRNNDLSANKEGEIVNNTDYHDQSERSINPSFDKEKYMKNN